MKGISLFMILALAIGSIKTTTVLHEIEAEIAKAALKQVMAERNKELASKLTENEIAKNMIALLKGQNHNVGGSKQKRILKRRIVSQNEDDSDKDYENVSQSLLNGMSPLDILMSAVSSIDKSNQKEKAKISPHRQTLILRRPNDGGLSLFGDQADDNDVDEESPVMDTNDEPEEEPSNNILDTILGRYNADQAANDLDNLANRRVVKRRTVRRKRVHRKYKRTTIRKRVTGGQLRREPMPSDDDQNLENLLANALKSKLASTPSDPDDEDTDDDDKTPTVVLLKASDEPEENPLDDDSSQNNDESEYNDNSSPFDNNQQDNSGPLGFLGDLLTGLGSNNSSNNKSSKDAVTDNDNNDDGDGASDNNKPIANGQQGSGISIPIQLIGGLLSGLFSGIGNNDIDEDEPIKPAPVAKKTRTIHRVHKIHRIHHTKKVTIRQSGVMSNKSKPSFFNEPSKLQFTSKRLPLIDTNRVRYPLLAGMYGTGRQSTSSKFAFPSLGHGKYKVPFRPLSVLDYLNAPTSRSRPVIRKRHVTRSIRRRHTKRRVVHRKRVVTRNDRPDNSIRDIVNTIMSNLPQINNGIRI